MIQMCITPIVFETERVWEEKIICVMGGDTFMYRPFVFLNKKG
jgi:hypothetical protein